MTEVSWNPRKVSDTYKLSINDSFYREQILWSIYRLQVMKMRFTVLREPAQGNKIKKECSFHRTASPFSGTQRQLWGRTSLVGVAIPPRARPSDLTSTALARPSGSFLVGSLQSSRTQRPEILTLQGFGRHQVGRVSGLFDEVTLLRFLSVTLLLSVCSKHREEQITLQESEGILWARWGQEGGITMSRGRLPRECRI